MTSFRNPRKCSLAKWLAVRHSSGATTRNCQVSYTVNRDIGCWLSMTNIDGRTSRSGSPCLTRMALNAMMDTDVAKDPCSTANTAWPAAFAGPLIAKRFLGNVGRNGDGPASARRRCGLPAVGEAAFQPSTIKNGSTLAGRQCSERGPVVLLRWVTHNTCRVLAKLRKIDYNNIILGTATCGPRGEQIARRQKKIPDH